MRNGQDLVAGGFIGLEGTVYAAKWLERPLKETLPKGLLNVAGGFQKDLGLHPERIKAVGCGEMTTWGVREGGIFAALWNMAEEYQVGLTVYLRQIPVRQETIEICEALGLNPYRLLSGGCAVFAVDNGNDLLRELGRLGISGALIGKVTEGRDRLILNGESRGYLNRPAPDEIGKLEEIRAKGICYKKRWEAL